VGHDHGRAEQRLQNEVTVGDRVHAVLEHAFQTKLTRDRGRIERVGGAGQGRCAQGRYAYPAVAVRQPFRIALEHPGVGQQVVGQADRLGRLKMRTPGQQRRLVLVGAFGQRRHQCLEFVLPVGKAAGDKKPKIERHLVVAAAPGVQLAPGVADQFGQPAFDVHMHVFEFGPPDKGAGLDLGPDRLETVDDVLHLRGLQHALAAQHARVGLGAGDVLGVELPVEGYRLGEGLHQSAGLSAEAPAPEFLSPLARHSLPIVFCR